MTQQDVAALVAARMKQAREELGLTLRDAAMMLGFDNYQVLSNIEKARREIKTAELVAFARAYHRDLSFFLETKQPTLSPAVRWRDRADTPATKLAEQRFRNFLGDYASLEKVSGRGPAEWALGCSRVVSGWPDAERLGQETYQQMELGRHPALEIRDVLEDRYGVKLLIAMMPGAGSAASAMDDFGAGILVNAEDAPWRISYDLAHEFFHLLTWKQDYSSNASRAQGPKAPMEQYADKFASVLLLPEASIGEEFRRRVKGNKLSVLDCVEMAREFGVSTEALLWRLVSLRLLRSDHVKNALASEDLRRLDKSARRKDWVEHPGARPSKRFVAVAFECLKKGLVSRGRFAELMSIRRGAIAAFLAEYGYDEAEDYVGAISTP